MSRKHTLGRRTILRGLAAGGVAVAVGLPRLGAMLDDHGTAYAAGGPLPKRYLTWFFGNGIIPSRWNPRAVGSGSAWQLTEQLMPLAAFKPYMTVLTGYEAKVPPDGLQPHVRAPAAIFTGAGPVPRTSNAQAPSVDQLVAKLIAGDTPFKSLEVGLTRAGTGFGGTLSGAISFNGLGSANLPEYDAQAVFTRLFGRAPAPAAGSKPPLLGTPGGRKSVLDLVKGDLDGLRPRLGVDDRRRVDGHLEGLRQLEGRLAALPSGAACKLPGTSYPARSAEQNAAVPPAVNAAMSELVAYALSCDLTRVATYLWSRAAAHVDFRVLGITQDIHDDISHKEPGDQPTMNKAILHAMEHLAVFLGRLKSTPDGAGNLLDSSVVLVTSDVSLGREHSVDELPVLLVGKAGGALRGDLHHRSTTKETVTKIPFSLLNVFGANLPSWGAAENRTTDGVGAILA